MFGRSGRNCSRARHTRLPRPEADSENPVLNADQWRPQKAQVGQPRGQHYSSVRYWDTCLRPGNSFAGDQRRFVWQWVSMDLMGSLSGFEVHVVVDGCSSRSMVDRMFAFERMKAAGIITAPHCYCLTNSGLCCKVPGSPQASL